MNDHKAGVGSQGIREGKIGTKSGGEQSNITRLRWVFGMHEEITVFIMFVALGGVDAGKPFVARISCEKNRFHLLVRLTLPALLRQFLAVRPEES